MTKLVKILGPNFIGGIVFEIDEDVPSDKTTWARKATSKVRFMQGFREHQIVAFCKLKKWEIKSLSSKDLIQ